MCFETSSQQSAISGKLNIKGYNPNNSTDVIFEVSRNFYIGTKEYEYNDEDKIFSMSHPLNKAMYHNTPEGCSCCSVAWKKASDLNDSHCHFCGKSSCKKCMTKTRPF